ncbi:hypothetical protein CBS101457_002080 [Exobasidium rhododendri]|nr:hypothetical protein CBS101457_002080 [Exobasidium rhododendri]
MSDAREQTELYAPTEMLAMPSADQYASMPLSPAKSLMAASSSTPIKSSTQNRRQQAAQRAKILALSKQLTTRLQYATFKVEHGWVRSHGLGSRLDPDSDHGCGTYSSVKAELVRG